MTSKPDFSSTIDPALDPTLDHVSRRTFLKRVGGGTVAAAVIGEGASAAAPPSALSDPTLEHQDVHFPSGSHTVQGFLCHPAGTHRRGSVVVIHEIFGLNDHIRDIACRLARAGYAALAVNYFTREGEPPSMDAGFPALMEFVGKIPDSQVVDDTRAALRLLRHQPHSNGKVGVVGFCWGGYYSMLAAGEISDLNAAIAYYGRIRLPEKTPTKPHSPLDLAAQMHAPLLGHFGALDRGIPPADADALREELKKHHKKAEIYEYEGAGHAFNNDTRESYNAEAAKLAWQRTLGWFEKYLRA